MKASDLIQMLLDAGWQEVRQKGSHRIFKHPDFPRTISIPDHGKSDLKIGTLNAILKQAGLK
ncbi:type II toxin-antitoxin system HicA family toxin [Larkinella soli]|uniref:type II toxin-antitoxin system HicA family toxin n=1 Tax=Larkinella soli TaxID=1770527 RepID=UPI000FFB77FC|nr:type II toxin-antitoxin system HicA family toxin [Larkinella soli]